MAIQIKYAQAYMQLDGKMTIDLLLNSTESSNLVVAVDPYSSDVPPKSIGPRYVMCLTANQPCFAARLTNVGFNDPYHLYLRRCISGPSCSGLSCTTFSSTVDSSYTGETIDFGSPGISGVPSQIFGSPHPVPSNIQGTCVTAPCKPPNDIYSYCDTTKPGYGYIWNQVACKYDYGALSDAVYHCGTTAPTVLTITGVTVELSTASGFPGNQGWTRINVSATGSGSLSASIDGTQLFTDGPFNPGSSPSTYTYLQQLTPGTKNICIQAIGGNKICTTFTVPPLQAGTFIISANKTTINIGDSITFTGNYYMPNTSINLYYQTVVGGAAIPYKNHLATALTDANGNYSSSMVLTTIVPGTIRVGACSPGSLGFECGSDTSSNTVDVTVTTTPPSGTSITIDKTNYILGDIVSIKSCVQDGYVYILDPSKNQTFKADIPKGGCRTDTYTIVTGQPDGQYTVRVANYSNITLMEKYYNISTAPLPVPITLKADKTTIITGDIVTFTGTYKPNTTVNIFIEGLVRTHLTQVTTDSNGNFRVSLQITNEGTLQIKACATGIGFECDLLSEASQAVSLVVNPKPVIPLTFYTDKTIVADGENLTMFGEYKPNVQINIYYQTLVAGEAIPFKNHFATVNTDNTGKYLTTVTMSVSVAGTIRMGACSLGGLGFECGSDVSNIVDITVTAAVPTAFTLAADKSEIKSGDTVTFTGKYSPGKQINIYVDKVSKTHITTATTDSNGNYSTSAKLTSTIVTTVNISACTVSAVYGVECELGGVTSNTISISITPPGVTPPPGLKWKLNTDLSCTQPADNSGTYTTKEACLLEAEKQKSGSGGISTGTVIGVAALAVVAVAMMKKE